LAIYKRDRGFELGTTENKSSKWPERDSNPGPPDFESDALTTRLRCLPNVYAFSIVYTIYTIYSVYTIHSVFFLSMVTVWGGTLIRRRELIWRCAENREFTGIDLQE